MKATELIEKLQKLVDKYGNVEVLIDIHNVTEHDISSVFYWRKEEMVLISENKYPEDVLYKNFDKEAPK